MWARSTPQQRAADLARRIQKEVGDLEQRQMERDVQMRQLKNLYRVARKSGDVQKTNGLAERFNAMRAAYTESAVRITRLTQLAETSKLAIDEDNLSKCEERLDALVSSLERLVPAEVRERRHQQAEKHVEKYLPGLQVKEEEGELLVAAPPLQVASRRTAALAAADAAIAEIMRGSAQEKEQPENERVRVPVPGPGSR